MSIDVKEHPNAQGVTHPYLIVSGDSHAGPSLEDDLRPYCSKKYLQLFDEFAVAARSKQLPWLDYAVDEENDPARPPLAIEAIRLNKSCRGHRDPQSRLADMDSDGIAAEVIYAGGLNDEILPFGGRGIIFSGNSAVSSDLLAEGCRIWNRWLADFVSESPERLVGVMQIPIEDIPAAIREVEWGRNHGLRAINFPAPRSEFPSYNELVYEPLWSACEAVNVPLCCHSAGGEKPLGSMGLGARSVFLSEVHWLSRRALWQLIFGGVFDRHPSIRVVFTEQRADWVVHTLRDLDSIYYSPGGPFLDPDRPLKSPTEYFRTNVSICASFPAPYEIEMRDAIGIANLHWGRDYPHPEGTWPRTALALRHAFGGVPQEDVATILGSNALRIYNLDESFLRPIADRIGPAAEDLATPLSPSEYPDFRGYAFRDIGTWG